MIRVITLLVLALYGSVSSVIMAAVLIAVLLDSTATCPERCSLLGSGLILALVWPWLLAKSFLFMGASW